MNIMLLTGATEHPSFKAKDRRSEALASLEPFALPGVILIESEKAACRFNVNYLSDDQFRIQSEASHGHAYHCWKRVWGS